MKSKILEKVKAYNEIMNIEAVQDGDWDLCYPFKINAGRTSMLLLVTFHDPFEKIFIECRNIWYFRDWLYEPMCEVVNKLNYKYHYVRFVADDFGSIYALYEAKIHPEACEQEVTTIVQLVIQSICDAFPEIVSAIEEIERNEDELEALIGD